ncbi:phospholipase A1 PLIP1, chloroplastic [Malania oleifera]|uniref:phospholipase A1 PLIP1, chloroplastic n=1 Tax=Malania oleifera TaxID=397392 RepID=UPI0025ADC03F|nr:phospholipase A1 PLIP1, chloroplastic [Malania oleifera]
MTCTSVSISSSQVAAAVKDALQEGKGKGLSRSHSAKDLSKQTGLRRSCSDHNLSLHTTRIRAASAQPKLKSSRSTGILPFHLSGSVLPSSLRSFLSDPDASKEMELVENLVKTRNEPAVMEKGKQANWVERIVEIRRQWSNRQRAENIENEDDGRDGGCKVDYGSEEEDGDGGRGGVSFDHESFSRFLVQVPWTDTKVFAKLAFLCNMAYVIPEIKDKDLRRYYGLRFVTSSIEKKAVAAVKAKLNCNSTQLPVAAPASSLENCMSTEKKKRPFHPVAYEIAASAACYVKSCAKDFLYLGSEPQKESENSDSHGGEDCPQEGRGSSTLQASTSKVAACVTASTMTAVVAAGEKEKQETAKDLQSLHSSPCEWFVCDDLGTCTRCFVIQGSDSLASWQANLLFEPTKFEGMEMHVHRGIYEAAKGIYEQFMPEIMDHLNRYGERAKLQFTGHSLGGSLSLLVNLMLLARKVVNPSSLLPVVTFGSPNVFCGGRKILEKLGLHENCVHCVMMHRDIVPRAFSCNYPNHIAQVLKKLNSSFRSHPCLNKKKLLYDPLGKVFILQPDEKSSPPHPLLPPGNALYALDKLQGRSPASALKAFLNCPHPLETLSDPTAYGSEGTILRDHDSSNYMKAVNGIIRLHSKEVVRKVRKQRNLLWPLLTSPSPHAWRDGSNLENARSVTKEIMTSV